MNLSSEKIVYDALKAVYFDGGYSSIVLNRLLKSASQESKAYITQVFYGVLGESIQFDYYIDKICDKKPQNAVVVLIKIGLYLLLYSNTPDFAAVNKTVELAKMVGKQGASGFINAVLKKAKSVSLPNIDTVEGLAINYSYPKWAIEKLIKDYDFEFTKNFVGAKLTTNTHIRVNVENISKIDFEKKYPSLPNNATNNGYYVTHNILKALESQEYIVQSLASMFAAEKYTSGIAPKRVLDLCAAPGGKAIYIKQLLSGVEVTACDIHEHRVELIKKYAETVGVKINSIQNDATKLNTDFADMFDLVVCDVPCSGIGVTNKKPEILFNKKPSDIDSLSALQLQILQNAANFVVKGGRLCYSTCTVFRQENDDVINAFLASNKSFALDGEPLKLYPHIDNCDGFFVANLKQV